MGGGREAGRLRQDIRGTGFAGPQDVPPVGGWRSDTQCAKPGGEPYLARIIVP